jgi:hypothetical protein
VLIGLLPCNGCIYLFHSSGFQPSCHNIFRSNNHAFHAAFPVATLKISPCNNLTLTLGWITLFMGDMGEGALHREVTVKQRNLNLVTGPTGGLAPRGTGQQTVGRNVTWNWTCVIVLQITDPSSHQRGRPTWKIKKVIVTQINVTSGHLLQKG